eukprot:15327368-Ditylum_brightwellii.AAC.1
MGKVYQRWLLLHQHVNSAKNQWKIPQMQKDDNHMMDIFLDLPLKTAEDLPYLNYCRYYLEATTIAEITTSDGTHILPQCLYPDKISKKTTWLID